MIITLQLEDEIKWHIGMSTRTGLSGLLFEDDEPKNLDIDKYILYAYVMCITSIDSS